MSRAESPSALLRRLSTTTPLARRSLVGAVVSGVLALVCTVAQAVVLASLLASAFAHAHAPIAGRVRWLIAITVVRMMIALLQEPLGVAVAAPVRRDLRERALRAVLAHRATGTTDATVQLCTRGIDAIESYLAGYVPALVLATAAPVGLLIWMAWTDWFSALIVALTVVMLPLFMVLLGLEAKEKMEERWQEQERLAGYFGDVAVGMATLKAHNRSRHAVDTLDSVGQALRDSTMATLRVAFLSSFALELLASLATALVAMMLGIRLLNGHIALSTALAILMVTPEVYLPLRRAAAQFHSSSDGVAAASSVLDLIDLLPTSGVLKAPRTPPTISVRGARATHVGRDHGSLEPVSFDVPSGTTTVLFGPSGVGKSTLLRCLAGLDELAEGTIIIDGTALAQYESSSWHEAIAWLPQDPHLPGNTIGDALRLGHENLTDDDLREALRTVELDVALDRTLGEGGGTLSAGQRRRLALARALLRSPSVMLLDEPTAHLDVASETIIRDVLARQHVTMIIATHREFAADQIVTLRAPERFGV